MSHYSHKLCKIVFWKFPLNVTNINMCFYYPINGRILFKTFWILRNNYENFFWPDIAIMLHNKIPPKSVAYHKTFSFFYLSISVCHSISSCKSSVVHFKNSASAFKWSEGFFLWVSLWTQHEGAMATRENFFSCL